MNTFITILRGINVGGNRIVKMQDLKLMLENMGFHRIQTYIQSGNVVFDAECADNEEISHKIQTEILNTFGFEVPVITFNINELEMMLNQNPFLNHSEFSIEFFHVTFLSNASNTKLSSFFEPNDPILNTFFQMGKCVYLYCPNGYSKTVLSNTFIERKLKVNATTRNWKTMNHLYQMAQNALKS